MSRVTVNIDDGLLQKVRNITGLRTEQEIISKALELLVRTESHKGILRYHGSGIWKCDLKKMRRNR